MGNCCSEQNNLALATLENTPELTLTGLKCDVKVIDVHDGDTITIAFFFGGRIFRKSCRVNGVDCAEIRTKDKEEKQLGLQATQFVKDLLLNKIVWAEFSDKNDKYGRLLATIHVDSTTLDKILIQKGYGYEYHGEKKQKFSSWHNPDTN